MSVMLATLCLNEIEHLENLYNQHRDWPELTRWVFVEAADDTYAKTNPKLVSSKGLSVDGTSSYLSRLAAEDSRVVYIPHGFTKHPNPAQGKVPARNRYLEIADEVKPNFVMVLDADEFYTATDQVGATLAMSRTPTVTGFCFRQRHIWKPQAITKEPLFRYEVVGGYWGVPHTRGWKYKPGMRYVDNHNTPCDSRGRSLGYTIRTFKYPQCVHLGFASGLEGRAAKHRYYEARGEGPSDGRQRYVDCRAAFETWREGKKLPHGAKVVHYNGPVPECFNVAVEVAGR